MITTSGVPKRVAVYGKTRDGIREKITALEVQDNQGIPTPDTNVKMADYLAYWLATVVKSTADRRRIRGTRVWNAST
ncbi:hypothetical protein [Kitasatospora sp. NPDC085879]|uniref:hypothetical protein n=1 Tax=Kitasatospora sp. NPDC085879 TaxID=3154769 RepID=UPI00341D55BE